MRPYTLLDVFTDTPLAGNALAVVHAADGITAETMLAFARETRLAETTFVQTASEPGATYRNRIWTIAGEMPFAGHPSLGTAVAESILRGDEEATYVQQTHAGLQEVRIERSGDRATASVVQEPATFTAPKQGTVPVAALGLDAADSDPALAPCLVSTGFPTLLVPLRDAAAVGRARPGRAEVATLAPDLPDYNIYAFAFDAATGTAHARCFPFFELEHEDPATGSAAGPLLAYLNRELGINHLVVTQGLEINRPSRLTATLEGDRVRVTGDVVVIATGQVRI